MLDEWRRTGQTTAQACSHSAGLHPGDRLVIPPGLPHLFTATAGHTFTYVIFKQKV